MALQLRSASRRKLQLARLQRIRSPPIHPTQHHQTLSCKCIIHGILAAANASRIFELQFGAHSRLRADGARCHQLLSFPCVSTPQPSNTTSSQHLHTGLSFIAYALDTAEGAPLRFSAYICFSANCRFRFGGSQPRNRSPTSFPPSTTNYLFNTTTQRSLMITFELVAYPSVTARLAYLSSNCRQVSL